MKRLSLITVVLTAVLVIAACDNGNSGDVKPNVGGWTVSGAISVG